MSSSAVVASTSAANVLGATSRGGANVDAGGQKVASQSEAASSRITVVRSASAPSVQETASVTRESVEAAAVKIQSFVSSLSRNLNISVDNASGKTVIRVVDPLSNEMVRQIPGEEALRLARTIDFLSSMLVNQKV